MMKLPATIIEANVLAYAKQCVRFMHEGSIRAYGASWFTKEGNRYFARQFLKRYALTHPLLMDEIIDGAMQGWPDAQEALGDLVSEFLGRGQQLPPQLATYNIHALNGLSSLRGPRKSDKVMRNLGFALIIAAQCKHFSLSPLGNRVSKRRSATDNLHQALRETFPTGIYVPRRRGIEDMWETSGPKLVAMNAKCQPPIVLPAPDLNGG